MMSTCLNCGKELVHTPGRKEKKYCDNKCRMSYYNRTGESHYVPKRKHIPIERYEELIKAEKELKKQAAAVVVYDSEPVAPINDEYPQTQAVGKENPPKTLAELKKRCPVTLKGLGKSEWIANKRQEFGL